MRLNIDSQMSVALPLPEETLQCWNDPVFDLWLAGRRLRNLIPLLGLTKGQWQSFQESGIVRCLNPATLWVLREPEPPSLN